MKIVERRILSVLPEMEEHFTALQVREALVNKYGTNYIGNAITIGSLLKRHCKKVKPGVWKYV